MSGIATKVDSKTTITIRVIKHGKVIDEEVLKDSGKQRDDLRGKREVR